MMDLYLVLRRQFAEFPHKTRPPSSLLRCNSPSAVQYLSAAQTLQDSTKILNRQVVMCARHAETKKAGRHRKMITGGRTRCYPGPFGTDVTPPVTTSVVIFNCMHERRTVLSLNGGFLKGPLRTYVYSVSANSVWEACIQTRTVWLAIVLPWSAYCENEKLQRRLNPQLAQD